MDLLLNDELVMDEISESAPQFFPATMVTANLSSVEGDCITHVLPRCTTSALNPFQTGVNVTMEYGQYLDVSPDALTSFYTNSFLGEMASCTLTGDCEPEAPEALQVRFFSCWVSYLCCTMLIPSQLQKMYHLHMCVWSRRIPM